MLPESITILSLEDIGCTEEIEETSNTIEGNAILKANYVTEKYGYDCFADDTGLEVDALNGEPGVYSARYAGEQKDANENELKVTTANGWFAARPSGTEDIYKIYAESFISEEHLELLIKEAQDLVIKSIEA